MINLNYYKISPNSKRECVFSHFDTLEDKLKNMIDKYDNIYRHGSLYNRAAIFFDKHFDSFCREEFLYYRISQNKYTLKPIKTYKWQTKDFSFKMSLSKVRTGLINKYVSYIDVSNSDKCKPLKLLVIYKDYKTALIETERLSDVLKKLSQRDVLEIIFRNEERRINNMSALTCWF